MTLDKLPIGKKATIASIDGKSELRCRLLDMGFTPHTSVEVKKVAPMGDPIELRIRDYEITLRLEDAKNIQVEVS